MHAKAAVRLPGRPVLQSCPPATIKLTKVLFTSKGAGAAEKQDCPIQRRGGKQIGGKAKVRGYQTRNVNARRTNTLVKSQAVLPRTYTQTLLSRFQYCDRINRRRTRITR